MKKALTLTLALIMLLTIVCVGPLTETHADAAWPTRPVNVTVAASAGGATDIIVRKYAEKFQEVTGQPMVITNVSGAAAYVAINGLSTLELKTNGLPLHLQSDYLNTLTVLKDRKVDVLIPSHAGHAVDYPFFEIAAKDDGTGNGFIDPGAWKRMIESRIEMVKALIAKEKAEEAAN